MTKRRSCSAICRNTHSSRLVEADPRHLLGAERDTPRLGQVPPSRRASSAGQEVRSRRRSSPGVVDRRQVSTSSGSTSASSGCVTRRSPARRRRRRSAWRPAKRARLVDDPGQGNGIRRSGACVHHQVDVWSGWRPVAWRRVPVRRPGPSPAAASATRTSTSAMRASSSRRRSCFAPGSRFEQQSRTRCGDARRNLQQRLATEGAVSPVVSFRGRAARRGGSAGRTTRSGRDAAAIHVGVSVQRDQFLVQTASSGLSARIAVVAVLLLLEEAADEPYGIMHR